MKRFWDKVDVRRKCECWEWNAAALKSGYGVFGLNRDGHRNMLAHRMAWTLTNGEIPDGSFVLHKCDNPSCCNPSHLFLGTQADNIHDMDRKGRRAIWRGQGEKNGQAKLVSGEVMGIRNAYIRGSVPLRVLAEKYDVSISTVFRIVKIQGWKHL